MDRSVVQTGQMVGTEYNNNKTILTVAWDGAEQQGLAWNYNL